ncbi:Holin of 3TMs, for gene-transfer release [Paracoccus solventivorans]|uniref:Holin of 3TMs, for gene-transfer release n=1 Tax=Paracoccus solventivorans TaxID=53463 RepID=A0A1M7D5B0_9RHOB|nr:3TM-type holin [Paracoccus solventivorans]SHL74379.1 Holin of 3TMs, for gene-transfer release [Paracoccus solventivorans]
MGLIDRLTSRSQQISTAAGAAARVAQALAARKVAPSRDAAEGLARIEAEFARGGFDGLVNALNRLPRPLLMLGAVAVGGYAMLDPEGFAARVEAMAGMPEPLWWLSGAMLGLHFVGREGHYWRNRLRGNPEAPAGAGAAVDEPTGAGLTGGEDAPTEPRAVPPEGDGFADNAALRDWAGGIAATTQR